MDGQLVYFLVCGDWLKVGYSNDLPNRLKALQTSNAHPITLLMTIRFDSEKEARRAEAEYRKWLSRGTETRGEWVKLEADRIGPLARLLVPVRLVSLREFLRDPPTIRDIILESIADRGLRLNANLLEEFPS
jgi:predicted GIY-YIG superfamily endonuclease